MILDYLDYETGSFEGFVMEDTNYVTWFLQSSVKPIIDDYPMSGGRVVDGIARTRQASEAHLRLLVDTLQAWVRELESATTTRDRYVQEEIAISLTYKEDQWQKERRAHAIVKEIERSQLLVKIGMLYRYIDILIDETRGHRMPVPFAPHILSRYPPFRRHELEYMPIPLGPTNNWGCFPLDDQAQGLVTDQAPFQVLGYAPGSSIDQASLFTGPTVGDDANGSNVKYFTSNTVRDDDSPCTGMFHFLNFIDIAPWWIRHLYLGLPLGKPGLYFYIAPWQALDMYVLYCPIMGPDV